VNDSTGNHIAHFANVGQLVTWIANISGTWSGDGVAVCPTGTTCQVRYSTVGNKSALINGNSCTTLIGLPNGLPIINDPNFKPF
jgi:hypothetical protein